MKTINFPQKLLIFSCIYLEPNSKKLIWTQPIFDVASILLKRSFKENADEFDGIQVYLTDYVELWHTNSCNKQKFYILCCSYQKADKKMVDIYLMSVELSFRHQSLSSSCRIHRQLFKKLKNSDINWLLFFFKSSKTLIYIYQLLLWLLSQVYEFWQLKKHFVA